MREAVVGIMLAQAAATMPSASPLGQATANDTVRSGEVVVTAHPLAVTERALAECIARRCSPKEDIAASIAHAENQLIAGDYHGARKTLLAARRRDAGYAAQYPVEVAGLLRANARVASYVGLPDVSRINQIDTLDALKKGLPPGDARILAQRLDVGDAFARQRDFDSAVDIYRHVGREAHRKHLSTVEGMAMLREAVLYSAIALVAPAYQDVAADARRRLLRTSDPALQPFREAAGGIVAALGAKPPSGPAEIPNGSRSAPPRLVYQPVIDNRKADLALSSSRSGPYDFVQWADVAFHIDSNGNVRDVVVLRHSDPFDQGWLIPVQEALVKRRYTGYPADVTPPGVDRTERYSFVHDAIGAITGSRISGRSTIGRIELLDLTVASAPSRPVDHAD